MRTKPLISVIIPAYNEEKYISKSIESLLSQIYKYLEIIVVDDGSTDKTREIIKRYPVKLINQKHKGLGASRNNGVSHSKGKLLALLDADLVYDRKYIQKLAEPIFKKNAIGTFNKEEFVANTYNIWSNCWAINSDLPINRRNNPKELPDEIPTFQND